jgi:CDGSH-type Zn-finger protein
MPTTITTLPNGPLLVRGPVELVDREGTPFDTDGATEISLCRCGQSAGKPFCDRSHARTGFREPGIARDLAQRPGERAGSGCRIVVNSNGALRLEGDFVLLDSAGTSYGLGGRPSIALCRCGGSKDRPFCDGRHEVVGFRG